MILVDTNTVARTLQRGHKQHRAAMDSIALLKQNESETFVTSVHNLYELYFIMTKPLASSGFGHSAQQARTELAFVERVFQPIAESSRMYDTWKQLVGAYNVVNRPCFDAKIVASMIENAIPRILTFNDQDFKAFAEIKTLNPFDVLGIPRI